MILTKETDIIEVLLGGAVTTNELECVAEWDNSPVAVVTQDKFSALTNGTTPVSLVVFEQGTNRLTVTKLSVYNSDTAAATVTIRLNDNGTYFNYTKKTLQPGETLQYNIAKGFFLLDPISRLLALSTFEIQMGLVPGVTIANKSGRNSVITSASAPEDMWNGSTVYTGFPTGAPETLQFFSSNAGDTGTLTYMYLATSTSTVWQSATVVLNGVTPVNGVSAYRVHSANYNAASATGFNLGTITCRHSVTTANVFFQMPIGTSQTYVAAYTVPFGSTGFVKKVFCDINTTTNVAMQGALWVRSNGGSPRLRRNFNVSNTVGLCDDGLYLKLPQMTDITMRITNSSSGSSQTVIGGFDIIVINKVL